MKRKDWKELSKRDPHEVATHEDIEKLRKEERGLGKTLIGAGALNYALGVGAKKVYNNPESSSEAKAKIDSRKVHGEVRSGYAKKNIRGAKRTGAIMAASGAALIGYTHYKHYKDKKCEATEKTFADAFTPTRMYLSTMAGQRSEARLRIAKSRAMVRAAESRQRQVSSANSLIARLSADSAHRRSSNANQFSIRSKPALRPSKTVSMR